MRQPNRTRSIVLCGLSIALLAVGAFITVPFGPIPFTLQTLMLVLVVLILTPAESLVAVGGYLLLGALGLPVFAGFRGGLGVLVGPTGGFLLGFFVGTLIFALIRIALRKRELGAVGMVVTDITAAVVISLASYAFGTLWFSVSTQATIPAALAACVVPFVVPDVIKAMGAIACAQPVRAALGRSAPRRAKAEGTKL
ncbi:MAG: biotin transporter BioY [Coriobacteriales bacterium]|jgi:biotin transport system substrate-specific component|nr:biotin transporter BioY [Coriobacteriales bacterium]